MGIDRQWHCVRQGLSCPCRTRSSEYPGVVVSSSILVKNLAQAFKANLELYNSLCRDSKTLNHPKP